MTILVVEDEKKLADILKKALTRERYAVDIARDGAEGLAKAVKNGYNLILLDLMLPKKDGIQVCIALRNRGIETPVIMLTARGLIEDRIKGLDVGADDYLVKPFGIDELFARMRAVLRRRKALEAPLLKVGDLTLDQTRHEVRRAGKRLALAPKQYRLLDTLVRHAGHALTRRQLIDEAWGPDFVETNHELNVHMRYLRRMIDPPRAKPLIHTIRGTGYTIRA